MDKQNIINQLKELRKMMINTAESMESYIDADEEWQQHAQELKGASSIIENWIKQI